ncbi:MAG: hypothetical protein AB1644_03950 [Candidatus Zixiibacteriota bacterium]
MSKKTKRTPSVSPRRVTRFEPETTRWFTPVAFGVLFVILIILFSEFIFSNKMLFMSDQIQAGVFFRSFYVNYFDAHHAVPQWNPYIFGGMPFVDAFHGDIFYPLTFLKFFDNIYRMLGMNLFLHIFLSGIFMYLCARQFKLSKVASLLAGVCYMFSGYLVSLVAPGHDGKIFVTTLFPLVILFLDRGFEAKPFLNFTLLGGVIGLIILTPHPQMAYFTLWGVSFYAVYKLGRLYLETTSIPRLIRPALLTAYAVVIGLLISAIQFYPGYNYTTNFSPRADSKKGWDWATSWSMHEEEAFSLLIPEFCGSNVQGDEKNYYWGKNVFKDNSESVGVVALFLGIFGLTFSRRKERWFFGGLALFALVYALGATTPIFKLFYYLIPKVSSLRAPSMIMFLFLFSISLLAAMGLQHLLDGRRVDDAGRDKKFRYLVLGFPALLLLLALLFSAAGRSMISTWCSLFYSDASRSMVQEGVSKLDLAFINLPSIQAGAWLSFLFAGLAALCIWLYREGKVGPGILMALVLVPAIDGARFDKRFIGTFDPIPQWGATPVTQFFKSDPGEYRVMNIITPTADVLPFHGIEVVAGYHGNQLRWYDDLLGGPALTNRLNARFLNLVGTKYLITPPNQSVPAGYFGDKPVTPVATFGESQIMRNENAFPRVYLVDQYHVIPDRREINTRILTGTENMRTNAYLEEDPGITIEPGMTAADSAWVIDHDIDSAVVGVSAAGARLLILADTYYDSWHAYVDNAPVKLLRAYGAFRAVAVPAGNHTVSFRYHSSRYTTGRMITWLTSLYVLAIIGLHFFRNRRKSKPVEVMAK